MMGDGTQNGSHIADPASTGTRKWVPRGAGRKSTEAKHKAAKRYKKLVTGYY